ncbi:alpha/beta hydrolase [Streptomyces sp. NPDC088766]|uniref:alpha/beta hydrolase n=1 Tax=Streptomyces sp. NPDC088766 TaxID=3365893 RepID=UPI00381A2515
MSVAPDDEFHCLIVRQTGERTGGDADRGRRSGADRAGPRGRRDAYGRLAPAGCREAYLLGFSADEDGRAIVADRNPDTADRRAVHVPGTTAEQGKAGGDINRMTDLWRAANTEAHGQSVSTVTWPGYGAPDDAVKGAPLERAVRTLRMRRSPRVPLLHGRPGRVPFREGRLGAAWSAR